MLIEVVYKNSKPIRFNHFMIFNKIFNFNILFRFKEFLLLFQILNSNRTPFDDAAWLNCLKYTLTYIYLNFLMKDVCTYCISFASSSSIAFIWSKICFKATATVLYWRGRSIILVRSSFAAISLYIIYPICYYWRYIQNLLAKQN